MGGINGRGRGESDTSPRKITARERQARALRLRLNGCTYQQIADELGYANPAGARKAILTAMQATIQEPADEYRTMHRERLFDLYRATMRRVMLDDANTPRAAEVARGVLDSLAKLDDLDAPKRMRIRFEDDLEAETRAMAVQAGLDPDEAVEDVREMLRQQQKAT